VYNAYIGGHSENNIKCVVRDSLGQKNQTTQVFCHVIGFTSDFLSFIVVEHIRFFHRALQLLVQLHIGYYKPNLRVFYVCMRACVHAACICKVYLVENEQFILLMICSHA